jgi:hypothetical protein
MKLSTVTLSCFTAVCREKGFSPAAANQGKHNLGQLLCAWGGET